VLIEVVVLLPHLIYLLVIVSLFLLNSKFSVAVVQILQTPNQRLLREVQPQLQVYLLL
jgi:hypothetical protein